MKNEVEFLKQKSIKTKDKVTLFIKLIRKYAKKLSVLSQKVSINKNQNTEQYKIFNEINNTIIQLNQMIYNPMLNENVFEITNLDFEDDNIQFNNKSFINNYDNKIIELNNENEKLKKNFETIQKNFEMKLIESKNQIEEIQQKYNYSNKLSKELQNKINLLDNENNNYKIKFQEMNDKLSRYEILNEKILSVENELKYKKAIIKYLEGLLKSLGINPKLYTDDTYRDEIRKENNYNNINNNENIDDYLEKNNNTNDSINNFNHGNNNNFNNESYLDKGNLYNLQNEDNKFIDDENDNDDYQENRPRQIKKEIDTLDEEIFELQSKLKKMLNKK